MGSHRTSATWSQPPLYNKDPFPLLPSYELVTKVQIIRYTSREKKTQKKNFSFFFGFSRLAPSTQVWKIRIIDFCWRLPSTGKCFYLPLNRAGSVAKQCVHSVMYIIICLGRYYNMYSGPFIHVHFVRVYVRVLLGTLCSPLANGQRVAKHTRKFRLAHNVCKARTQRGAEPRRRSAVVA